MYLCYSSPIYLYFYDHIIQNILYIVDKWLPNTKISKRSEKLSNGFLTKKNLYFWSGPKTRGLNAKIVFMHFDPEKSIFTPICSPAVPSDPILFLTFLIIAPSSDAYFMVDSNVQLLFRINSTSV